MGIAWNSNFKGIPFLPSKWHNIVPCIPIFDYCGIIWMELFKPDGQIDPIILVLLIHYTRRTKYSLFFSPLFCEIWALLALAIETILAPARNHISETGDRPCSRAYFARLWVPRYSSFSLYSRLRFCVDVKRVCPRRWERRRKFSSSRSSPSRFPFLLMPFALRCILPCKNHFYVWRERRNNAPNKTLLNFQTTLFYSEPGTLTQKQTQVLERRRPWS